MYLRNLGGNPNKVFAAVDDSEERAIIQQAEEEAMAEAMGMASAGLISEDEIPTVMLSIREEILSRLLGVLTEDET